MQTKNLNKSLTEVFSSKYLVPLYQRNYAWSEEEISQLIMDLYEAFKLNPEGNYFIGSLVVLKRRDGFFEVIDGQQRLTTLTLLSKILNVDFLKEPKLYYESRPEVEAFLDVFYRTSETTDVTFDHKVSHLINAVDVIKETIINPEEKELLSVLKISDLENFKRFFSEKVILVRVEIPEDTDVATYFEIMNNRGEQLQKHEILKAKLMEKIVGENQQFHKTNQLVFSKIWDACSQIDIPIQKLFDAPERRALFGDEFSDVNGIDNFQNLITQEQYSNTTHPKNINTILTEKLTLTKNEDKIKDVEDESNDQSIIDYPNFLMHIFKLLYNTDYVNIKGVEIPLNEKDLISVYEVLKDKIDSMDFIKNILFYRTVFDRYVVKTSSDDNAEDNYKWTLIQPYKYYNVSNNSYVLKYKNTFDNQERVVKSLSLLQVTFRNKKYKNWLYDLLTLFKDNHSIHIDNYNFQLFLDNWLLGYWEQLQLNYVDNKIYSLGTHTPHFIFNFIDYLLWIKYPESNRPKKLNFEFKYRNSVEHHLPQSFRNENNEDYIDNIGNLCLISKNSNSKMNNEQPLGKASREGKYYKENLPPKQKIIYDITNENNAWGVKQIKNHFDEIYDLLNKSTEILKENNHV